VNIGPNANQRFVVRPNKVGVLLTLNYNITTTRGDHMTKKKTKKNIKLSIKLNDVNVGIQVIGVDGKDYLNITTEEGYVIHQESYLVPDGIVIISKPWFMYT